ncbi:MAG: class I adenylate-forming enzyme family protein [Bacilli bacterium]|nr:class I adenylate-forming enzyme family protein [Bacilli bacterium]
MNFTGYPSIDNIHNKDYSFFDRNPIIPDMSIYNTINMLSTFYRKEDAIDCLDLNVNYDEMINDTVLLSKTFKELGIKKGDIISVSMPNFYQGVIVYLAANRIGAVTTFINSMSSIEEVLGYLNEFESSLFINFDKDSEYNKKIKDNSKVKNIITLNKDEINTKNYGNITSSANGYRDDLSFSDIGSIAKYYKRPIYTLYGGKEDSLILFTSGSTGNPKSVVLTNQNILASGIYMKNTGRIKAKVGERCLVCVPFSYPYGFATSTIMSLICGRVAVLAPTLSKDNIRYYLSKNPNYVFGSPALLELIKRNVKDSDDLSSIHTFVSGGDFLTVNQNKAGVEFFRKHGAETIICNGSGNAETVGTNTMAVGSINKPETVGRVLVGTKAIVVNPDTLEEVKYGEEGMLCISGKHVFKGYYKNEDMSRETKFVYKGIEYYKTGNMGILDTDGYFTLTGRSSRYYIRSDLNKVYLEHIQNVISLIDVVDSCCVVPKEDKDLLFTNKAYVVLKDGVLPSLEVSDYIMNMCYKPLYNSVTGEMVQLKPFEVPESITFLDVLPRTKADKVDYTFLENMAKNEVKIKKKELK